MLWGGFTTLGQPVLRNYNRNLKYCNTIFLNTGQSSRVARAGSFNYNGLVLVNRNPMLKKIAYLILILIGGYILLQIPAVKSYTDKFMADLLQSKENVVSEYQKQQDNLNKLKTTVTDTVNTVKEVKDSAVKAADTLGKTAEAINGVAEKLK